MSRVKVALWWVAKDGRGDFSGGEGRDAEDRLGVLYRSACTLQQVDCGSIGR